MDTLLLDTVSWDLTVDNQGNIAVATGAYAIAQDAASQCRLFFGELWYDTTQGMPYLVSPEPGSQNILGEAPPESFMQAKFSQNALLVPNTAAVAVNLDPIKIDRKLTGNLMITDDLGLVITAGLGTVPWYVFGGSPQDIIAP